MVKPPPRADEEIAKAAMRDIAGNVTGRDQWKDYDERYVTQRIIRAIREAQGAAALAFFLILRPENRDCLGHLSQCSHQ